MFRIHNIVPIVVLLFCYMNIWRAYLIDSLIILVIITVITFCAAAFRIAHQRSISIPIVDVTIFFILLILMIGFVGNYQGEDVLKDIFLYHLTAMLFLPFLILMINTDVRKTVLIVFSIIFWADSFVILLELVDGLVGLDIHRFGLFNWYIKVNDPGRFLEITLHSPSFYEDIPATLGLRGYPNYTAPLFTASFVFLLAVKYAEKMPSIRFKRNRLAFFLFGAGLIFVLGVKTHLVTLVISVIFIAIYLNRSMFKHLLGGCLILALLVIGTELGSERFDIINEQLFEGGYQADEFYTGAPRIREPGRIETIFDFRTYSALLDANVLDFLFGATDFSFLKQWEYHFEQKIIIIGLVIGIPFIAIFLFMAIRSIKMLFKSFKLAKSDAEKGFCVGVLLAIVVLTLDTGHFGATFSYPNYQVMGFLIAVSVVLYKNIKNTHSVIHLNERKLNLTK